ncbi:B12-binding domain-containing radical SAM protein [Geosporobacter ferrireducens]|uniref:B12-binding domain-containing radical SAM protein n=1 Tax=Geosporobacter ferrireducens TaxID=1424294 RepID=UPI00235584C8|nr:radical SAM protein [Geosporobacter ferrireducens]
MRILLAKCHKKTIYSKFEPAVTEPLELEYLSALLEYLQIGHRIYDPLLEGSNFLEVFKSYEPDVLLLSGYITAVDVIIEASKVAKRQNPAVKVLVGGIHAEVNYEDFCVGTIDIVFHANGLTALEKILRNGFETEILAGIEGIAYRENKKWKINGKELTDLSALPMPNRGYFEKYQSRTKYMHYSPVAIVKTALSCPYQCSFCYCKQLNGGVYNTRSIDAVIEEIRGITAEVIWIVDDTFLIDRKRIQEFIKKVKKSDIKKKFIAYSRVDFIAKNEDIIQSLADIGLVELIVGMEAVEDQMLKEYQKACSAYENLKAVGILKKHHIQLTALFIVGIDFSWKDFRNLRRWIRKMDLQSYTASIFTPIKGTAYYEDYKSRLLTHDPAKYDFLHLTLKPTRMHALSFYFQFYCIYLEQFFRSKYIRSFLLNRWRSILPFGGKHA